MLRRSPWHRATLTATAIWLAATAQPTFGQTSSTPDLPKRLAVIERNIEAKRVELGVPGLALVIVKDDQVIYQKGLGVRGVYGGLPVTIDTLFPLASTTKAFTAMALLISEDMGLLSLDDPPRKYLPYFKLYDPDADTRVTIRHLLTHTSGIPRMDFAWGLGTFTREEVIRVLARVRPKAKLGERFQYNNTMYVAAGEVLGRVHGTTWEQAITDRLLKPLRMNATAPSTAGFGDAPDSARGHFVPGLGTLAVPFWAPNGMGLAAAGAISSNIRDMGQWVSFLLARGVFEGNRLVSEKAIDLAFSELIPSGGTAYGLGWHVQYEDGYKMVWHGGNLAGFHSFVFLVPEKRLGFAMLANTRSSRLPDVIASELWSSFILAKPKPKPKSKGGEKAKSELQ